MAAVPALDRPSRTRRGPAPAGAVVVGLVVAVVPLLTAVGTVAALRAGPDPGTASERDLPLGVVLLCLSGLLAGPAAAWTVRQDHPGAAVGLAVASAALALPVWAGWPWPPDVARAAALAAGPLAVGGLAQVGLRWGDGAAGPALQVTLAAVGLATGVHLLGYDPFADPWCARTCATVPAVLDGVLSTAATIAVSAALVVIAPRWRRPLWPPARPRRPGWSAALWASPRGTRCRGARPGRRVVRNRRQRTGGRPRAGRCRGAGSGGRCGDSQDGAHPGRGGLAPRAAR
jgi:hypothetical protein